MGWQRVGEKHMAVTRIVAVRRFADTVFSMLKISIWLMSIWFCIVDVIRKTEI